MRKLKPSEKEQSLFQRVARLVNLIKHTRDCLERYEADLAETRAELDQVRTGALTHADYHQ